MSIGTCVARACCVVVTAGVVSADPTPAREGDRDFCLWSGDPGVLVGPPTVEATGLLLGRLSKGHLRTWRAVAEVVAATHASGEPRSPTLRGLWEWAQATSHVLHVEMVSPSQVPNGMVGLFQIERVDPAGLRHRAVIRLCPMNIRRAVAGPGPNSVAPFARFEGLTEAERYAEVLAHELAHARYFLESPERLAQLVAAQSAIKAFLAGNEGAREPVHQELGRRMQEPLAVLAATEAHAESVEAIVLGELAGNRLSRTPLGRVR